MTAENVSKAASRSRQMTLDEAYKILGLERGAPLVEIEQVLWLVCLRCMIRLLLSEKFLAFSLLLFYNQCRCAFGKRANICCCRSTTTSSCRMRRMDHSISNQKCMKLRSEFFKRRRAKAEPIKALTTIV